MKYIDRTVISSYEPKTTDVMWVFPTENGETELRTFVNGKWKTVTDESDAYRKPQDGIPESDLSPAVKNTLDSADISAQIVNNKDHKPAQFSGLGRVNLEKNIQEVGGVEKNILTQDMFYKGEVGSRVPNTNTIFVIQYDYDLNEEEITIPEGCVLKFDGGSLSNGKIVGNNTKIEAGLVKIFYNVVLNGTWHANKVWSVWFDINSINDCTNELTWMFEMASKGIPLELEPKTYNVTFAYSSGSDWLKDLSYNKNTDTFEQTVLGYRYKYDTSNVEINIIGNGAVIYDHYKSEEPHENQNDRSLFVLRGCSGIVKDITFKNQTNFTMSESAAGLVAFHLLDGCKNMDMQLNADGLRTPIESGAYPWHPLSVSNSKFTIFAKNSGYGVAMYSGENCSFTVTTEDVHRGLYLGAINNGTINYSGSGKLSTGTAILFTQSRVIRTFIETVNGTTISKYICSYERCNNIESVSIFHSSPTINNNKLSQCNHYFIGGYNEGTEPDEFEDYKGLSCSYKLYAKMDCYVPGDQTPLAFRPDGNFEDIYNIDINFDETCYNQNTSEYTFNTVLMPILESKATLMLNISGKLYYTQKINVLRSGKYDITVSNLSSYINNAELYFFLGVTDSNVNNENYIRLKNNKVSIFVDKYSNDTLYGLASIISDGGTIYVGKDDRLTFNQKKFLYITERNIQLNGSKIAKTIIHEIQNRTTYFDFHFDNARKFINSATKVTLYSKNVSDVDVYYTLNNYKLGGIVTPYTDNKLYVEASSTRVFEFYVKDDTLVLANSYLLNGVGFSKFDTSISPARPIWWNGTAWVDATGTVV